MTKYRIETDTMGEVQVPQQAQYGAQTQRAIQNFTITREVMPWSFIDAILHIKRAAAIVNGELGLLSKDQTERISKAVELLLEKQPLEQFPVPVFQTGSGTSTNMNVNEVIAKIASDPESDISPNDHVNLGQSSNDVIPTAILVSTVIKTHSLLIPALRELTAKIEIFAKNNIEVVKTGRTHLMDALPIKLFDECRGWISQIEECIERFESSLTRLQRLPLGGTAVGSGVNCHKDFAGKVITLLGRDYDTSFFESEVKYKGLSSLDSVVEFMSHCKTCAVCLSKISNDLRWMNSGPHNGIGEIQLPALQPGSSIMPAKVNPVIPEAVLMACAKVIGNETTINIAGLGGSFQLNTMLPLAAVTTLESIELLAGSATSLGQKAFSGIVVNREKIEGALSRNPILVTSLSPFIGYSKAAAIAKTAEKEKRSVYEVAREQTDIEDNKLKELLNPRLLAEGGFAEE